MKRRAVVVIRQEDNTKNPSKAVTSIDTVVRRFRSTTTRSLVRPCEVSLDTSRSLGKHVCSWSWSQDVWTTIRARFLGLHVQSLSARGLEARRGSGERACAGSPKEAQRRSRNGCGGVWAMFVVDFFGSRRVLEAAVRIAFPGARRAALATALPGGSQKVTAGVSGRARRVPRRYWRIF